MIGVCRNAGVAVGYLGRQQCVFHLTVMQGSSETLHIEQSAKGGEALIIQWSKLSSIRMPLTDIRRVSVLATTAPMESKRTNRRYTNDFNDKRANIVSDRLQRHAKTQESQEGNPPPTTRIKPNRLHVPSPTWHPHIRPHASATCPTSPASNTTPSSTISSSRHSPPVPPRNQHPTPTP